VKRDARARGSRRRIEARIDILDFAFEDAARQAAETGRGLLSLVPQPGLRLGELDRDPYPGQVCDAHQRHCRLDLLAFARVELGYDTVAGCEDRYAPECFATSNDLVDL